jgi:hypothetical protein
VELTHDPAAQPEPQADGAERESVRLTAALDRLVDRGVLNRPQADAVVLEWRGVAGPPRPEGLRRRLGEIAGYLGASFVIGATLMFLSDEWYTLGRAGRSGILAVMAVVLFGSGLAVRLRAAPPAHRWWHPWTGDTVRRRLSSTLLTGAAVAAGFTAYAGLDTSTTETAPPAHAALVGSIVGLAVMIVGYLLARGALGQLGIAVAAVSTYGDLLNLADVTRTEAFGFGVLALGVIWVALVWWRLVTERRFALAIAVTLGLIGAQLVVTGDTGNQNFLGYALTALVAGACFTAYARMRDWVVLAGGVAGATLVVPEFLYDVTDGSLGASGVMLVAGVTLLAGSLVGLRIRRTPDPDPQAT